MYFDIVLLDEKCSKCIYKIFNSNDLVRTASVRWNNELSVYEKKPFLHIIVLLPRILHRILPAYYYLKKMKAITEDCCKFSKEESETIQTCICKL